MVPPPLTSQSVAGSSGSNFLASFRFLPKAKREALTRIYAFCRLSDDIVDLAAQNGGEAKAREELESWRSRTRSALMLESSHPVLRDFAAVVQEYKIPANYAEDLIDGVGMDLSRKRYASFEELYPYCYKVASVVGLMCLEVFGYRNERSREFAVNLGIAFQLTNILRDVRSDGERGRIYLPAEDLEKFGVAEGELLRPAPGSEEKLRALILFEAERAESYYRRAGENLPPEDRPALVAAEVMAAVYHALLAKIRRRPLALFADKISLRRPERVLRVLQGWLSNRLRLSASFHG